MRICLVHNHVTGQGLPIQQLLIDIGNLLGCGIPFFDLLNKISNGVALFLLHSS